MDDFEREIIETFLGEANEQIEAMEECLLEMESAAGQFEKSQLDHLLRILHTFKGNSASVGLNKASELSHTMESLLCVVKAREVSFATKWIDPLLSSIDQIKNSIGDFEKTDFSDMNSLIKDLDSLVSLIETGKFDASEAKEPVVQEVPKPAEKKQAAPAKKKKAVYQVSEKKTDSKQSVQPAPAIDLSQGDELSVFIISEDEFNIQLFERSLAKESGCKVSHGKVDQLSQTDSYHRIVVDIDCCLPKLDQIAKKIKSIGIPAYLMCSMAHQSETLGYLKKGFSNLLIKEHLLLVSPYLTLRSTTQVTESGTSSQDSSIEKLKNNLLLISLQDLPLYEVLEQAFDEICSMAPSKGFMHRGCIFSMSEDGKSLELQTYRQLQKNLHESCAQVKLGRCLCGKAAEKAEIVYAAHVDKDHSVKFEGMEDHGHYCVPLISKKNVVGVLNVYVQAGYERTDADEAFLFEVAPVVAKIIERKQFEKKVNQAKMQFVRSGKMASIGTIMANIINSIKEPLNEIRECSSEINEAEVVSESCYDRLFQSASSVSETINRWESSFKKVINQQENWKDLDVNEMIVTTLLPHQAEFNMRDIRVSQLLSKKLPKVYSNRIYFENVLQNFFMLSKEAFEYVTDNRSKRIVIMTTENSDNEFVLAYQDNSQGLVDFDSSYFSGTVWDRDIEMNDAWLGMLLAQDFAVRHQGSFSVESSSEAGTKIFLKIPIA